MIPATIAIPEPVPSPPMLVPCSECHGRGLISLWPPGRPREVCMARCEQCSGFGRVRG